MNSTTSTEHFYRQQMCSEMSAMSHLGLSFSTLSPSQFVGWVTLGLMTPGNKMMLFSDAIALNQCQDDKLALETLKQAQLLIPRGRALKLQLASLSEQSGADYPTQLLYDELLLEVEHRQLVTIFLVSDQRCALELDHQLAERYPALVYTIETLNDQYRFSTNELAQTMQERDSQVVISLLASPQQERLLSRLNRLLTNQLFIGVGPGLVESLLELKSSESTLLRRIGLWVRKRRHSILLRPSQWLSYVHNVVRGRLNPKAADSRLNIAIFGSAWRARFARTAIASKAGSFRLRGAVGRVVKRSIDLFGVGVGLLLLSPLLLLVALLIKLTSKGPIFYSQIRIGLRGKPFRMWKFRSMYLDADKRKAELEAQNEMAGGVLFKMKQDPRITPVGRVIRRLSIDELPQLINVLTGEMSLVGPRPALPKEVEEYPVLARARLEVKPGLTGLWQISGRSDLPFDKQVLLDTAYVHTQSAGNDIKLIAKTIPAVVSGKGAY